MPSYEWSSKLIEEVKTLGNPPVWAPYPLPSGPTLAISVQSPLGAGSYLERCELFASGSGLLSASGAFTDTLQLSTLSVLLKGEVYSTGSAGIPDPRTAASDTGAIRAAARMVVAPGGIPSGYTVMSGSFATEGYVTSHAVRGPAKYGGGTPELRIGLWTAGYYDPTFIGAMDSSSVFSLHALWRI